MTNPFDWKNQPAKIDMRDLDTARKTSIQQTAHINKRRSEGHEPSIIYSFKGRDTEPRKFTAPVPELDLHASSLRRNRRKGKT